MIANFYKKNGLEARNYKLIASKIIDCIPQKGTFIMFFGQLFAVDRIYFDVDKCEYNLYIIKVWGSMQVFKLKLEILWEKFRNIKLK